MSGSRLVIKILNSHLLCRQCLPKQLSTCSQGWDWTTSAIHNTIAGWAGKGLQRTQVGIGCRNKPIFGPETTELPKLVIFESISFPPTSNDIGTGPMGICITFTQCALQIRLMWIRFIELTNYLTASPYTRERGDHTTMGVRGKYKVQLQAKKSRQML